MRRVLKGEMVKSGVTVKDLSTLIHRTVGTVRLKLNDVNACFDLKEAELIRDTYWPNLTIDELFRSDE